MDGEELSRPRFCLLLCASQMGATHALPPPPAGRWRCAHCREQSGEQHATKNTHEVGPNSFYLTIDQYCTVRTHLLEPYRGTYWATRSAQRSYPTTTRQAVTAEEEQMKFMHGFVWPIHLHPSVKMSNLLSWCISDPPPIYMSNVHVTS